MKLKEKFEKALINNWLYDNAIKCEKIADDYAIELLEWLTNEKSKFAILYGNQKERFATIEKDYTSKKLLKIFKKEKGL